MASKTSPAMIFLAMTLALLVPERAYGFNLLRTSALRRSEHCLQSTLRHEGVKCDCCGMEPIVGARFTSSNVENVDVCSACVNAPEQTFSAEGKTFAELTWTVMDEPSEAAGSSANSEEKSYIELAGMGATGRYVKDAPDANDYVDDKDFRGAMLAREMEKREAKRASGKPIGNAAANSYMDSLMKPPPAE